MSEAEADGAAAPLGSPQRPEAFFYHLTASVMEAAAPPLLEKCLARGWRVTVRGGAAERIAALGAHLWTYDDAAFLPHGDASDGFAERQPIYLTAGDETPNAPQVLCLVDGAAADATEFAAFARVMVLFDGGDAEALALARRQWSLAVSAGARAHYWAQGEGGRWEKRRESA